MLKTNRAYQTKNFKKALIDGFIPFPNPKDYRFYAKIDYKEYEFDYLGNCYKYPDYSLYITPRMMQVILKNAENKMQQMQKSKHNHI